MDRAGCERVRITNDLDQYPSVSATLDGRTVGTTKESTENTVVVLGPGETSRPRQVSVGLVDGSSGLSWTPNGRLVFESGASGNSDIWAVDADGGGRQQLTTDTKVDEAPSASPDGRYVVFMSNRTGARNVWRMDADGSHPIRLTSGESDLRSVVSRDGRFVFYIDYAARPALWKVAIDGGPAVRVTEGSVGAVAVSPDGRSLGCLYRNSDEDPWSLVLLPEGGGTPTQTLAVGPVVPVQINFTPDGRALAYVRDSEGAWNVWSKPLDGGPARRLTDFGSDEIHGFAFSHDGTQLAVTRTRKSTDLILITDLR